MPRTSNRKKQLQEHARNLARKNSKKRVLRPKKKTIKKKNKSKKKKVPQKISPVAEYKPRPPPSAATIAEKKQKLRKTKGLSYNGNSIFNNQLLKG